MTDKSKSTKPKKGEQSSSSTQTKERKRADSTLEKSLILPNISHLISQRQTRAAKLKNDKMAENRNENEDILEEKVHSEKGLLSLSICKTVNLTMSRWSAKRDAQRRWKSLAADNLVAYYKELKIWEKVCG